MDFALNTYMSHAGIRLREARPSTTDEKARSAPAKNKWLPCFPKTEKSSNSKKEKDALEDKKRNPILKYIGKPKSSSQSSEYLGSNSLGHSLGRDLSPFIYWYVGRGPSSVSGSHRFKLRPQPLSPLAKFSAGSLGFR
nr:rho guanine nucleotide exchange factor 11-like isoform X2 [Aotus nancymaae]